MKDDLFGPLDTREAVRHEVRRAVLHTLYDRLRVYVVSGPLSGPGTSTCVVRQAVRLKTTQELGPDEPDDPRLDLVPDFDHLEATRLLERLEECSALTLAELELRHHPTVRARKRLPPQVVGVDVEEEHGRVEAVVAHGHGDSFPRDGDVAHLRLPNPAPERRHVAVPGPTGHAAFGHEDRPHVLLVPSTPAHAAAVARLLEGVVVHVSPRLHAATSTFSPTVSTSTSTHGASSLAVHQSRTWRS